MICGAERVFKQNWLLDTRLILAILLLAVALTPAFERLDIYVAQIFFNSETGEWLVPAGRPLIWQIFYRAPKVLLVAIGCCLLIALLSGFFVPSVRRYRTALLLSLLALGLIPSVVSWLKIVTDIYCPAQSTMFGGRFQHLGLFETYSPDIQRLTPGKCWPAGHASGGFVLMGIMVFAAKRNWRNRLMLSLPGLTLGWAMGIFQMARGNHYLTHTLASLGIALSIIWALEWMASTKIVRTLSPWH